MSELEHGQAVTHPAWCDRTRCTAPEQQPLLLEYSSASKLGEHLSAEVSGRWGETAYLLQAVAPWECTVYLVIEPNGSPDKISIGLDADSPLLLMIRQHVADQQVRYPSLVPPLDAPGESAGG